MKQSLAFLMAALLLAASCKNKPSNTITIKSEDGNGTVTVNVPKTEDAANALKDKMEELKKLAPLSLDKLKTMLPEEFMGMKRSNYSANTMMGAAMAEATYKSDDEKRLKISVIDCAGEVGASMYSLRYLSMMSFQSEDDNGYSKTIDFNGGKAVETYKKDNEEYSLTYGSADRLLVIIEGEKTGLDGVKEAAKNLNLKTD